MIAGELAQITAVGESDAVCRDRVRIDAHDRARAEASGWVRVLAAGETLVRASMQSSVRARDRAVVWADAGVSVTREGLGVSVRRSSAAGGSRDGDVAVLQALDQAAGTPHGAGLA